MTDGPPLTRAPETVDDGAPHGRIGVAGGTALYVAAVLGTGFYAAVAAVEKRLVFWGAEQ